VIECRTETIQTHKGGQMAALMRLYV
jgi:hypothetical protein